LRNATRRRIRAVGVLAIGFATLCLCVRAVADGDDEVTARAKRALVAAALPDVADILVTSFNGEVELSGTVRSEHVRDEAARVVAAVRGVTAVRNGLSARPPAGDRDSDDVLSDQVRTALLAAAIPDARNIRVRTFNGTAELTGSVGSDDSRATALRVAGQIQGITGVRDNLVVQRP
jgi:hyperosmotically inducible protein